MLPPFIQFWPFKSEKSTFLIGCNIISCVKLVYYIISIIKFNSCFSKFMSLERFYALSVCLMLVQPIKSWLLVLMSVLVCSDLRRQWTFFIVKTNRSQRFSASEILKLLSRVEVRISLSAFRNINSSF